MHFSHSHSITTACVQLKFQNRTHKYNLKTIIYAAEFVSSSSPHKKYDFLEITPLKLNRRKRVSPRKEIVTDLSAKYFDHFTLREEIFIKVILSSRHWKLNFNRKNICHIQPLKAWPLFGEVGAFVLFWLLW